MIIAQGGAFGGWALYVKDGRAEVRLQLLGMQEFVTEATNHSPPGSHQVRAEFAYDGGGLGQRRHRHALLRRPRRGSGRVEHTQPLIFSADETTDIGDDYGTPVSRDYADRDQFNGRIDVVQIDIGDDDHSHLIDPAEVVRVATARQ